MSVTRVGIHAPADVGRMIASEYNEDTGMTHEIYTCTDGLGGLVGRWHEDVGLVTWFRADTLAEARKFAGKHNRRNRLWDLIVLLDVVADGDRVCGNDELEAINNVRSDADAVALKALA
jgi:hypothetical protein